MPTGFQGRGTLFLTDLTGGWSESYYFADTDYPTCANDLIAVANKRKDILHESIAITHAVVSNIDIRGDAYLVPGANGPGTITDADGYAPLDNAIMVTYTVGVYSRNRSFLRGFPISQQIDGFYAPTTPFSTAMTAYINQVILLCLFRQTVPNPDPPPPATVVQYNAALRAAVSDKIGRRKTGRPFGAPRGRLIAP
jgi:hypothetical protein